MAKISTRPSPTRKASRRAASHISRARSAAGPRVSIVINNYNYGAYLACAIDSALAQSYPNTEVIVVDDGSTDTSREVISRYADRVAVVLKENGGQASAFNAGFRNCTGDVVIFLDADDILLPSVAERVAELWRAEPELSKVQYCMEVIDSSGAPTGGLKPDPRHPKPTGDLTRHAIDCPFDTMAMATSGNAFSARALSRILPMPEDMYGPIGADWYVSNLSNLLGPTRFLNEVGARYRLHGDNWHEPQQPVLDLEHTRRTLRYMHVTREVLESWVDAVLPQSDARRRRILSVSYVAYRLISLKLEPALHPFRGDTLGQLLRLGMVASMRRFEVHVAMKLLFMLWFVAMAAAPRRVAAWLARQFLVPETRSTVTWLLGALNERASHT